MVSGAGAELPVAVVIDGVEHWNPDSFRDRSWTIALHEAAHCAANHILGIPNESTRVTDRDGLTRARDTTTLWNAAVRTLAGPAFDRYIGLERWRIWGRSDLAFVRDRLHAAGFRGDEYDEMAAALERSTHRMVASERFQKLAHALGPKLARERYMGADEIGRILEANDSVRSTATAGRSSGSYAEGL
jgi:hypothetical protein